MSALAEAIVRRIEEDAVRELQASGREQLLEEWAERGYELVNSGGGWLNFMVAGQLVIKCRIDPDLEDLGRPN